MKSTIGFKVADALLLPVSFVPPHNIVRSLEVSLLVSFIAEFVKVLLVSLYQTLHIYR